MKYYEEYKTILAKLREEHRHEYPTEGTRMAKNRWNSRMAQKAIREISKRYPQEYREVYRKEVIARLTPRRNSED